MAAVHWASLRPVAARTSDLLAPPLPGPMACLTASRVATSGAAVLVPPGERELSPLAAREPGDERRDGPRADDRLPRPLPVTGAGASSRLLSASFTAAEVPSPMSRSISDWGTCRGSHLPGFASSVVRRRSSAGASSVVGLQQKCLLPTTDDSTLATDD
jgi:hypothetical protein